MVSKLKIVVGICLLFSIVAGICPLLFRSDTLANGTEAFAINKRYLVISHPDSMKKPLLMMKVDGKDIFRHRLETRVPLGMYKNQEVDKFAPGWKVSNWTRRGPPVILSRWGGKEKVLRTHPMKDIGCLLSQKVEVPVDGKATLNLVVGHEPQGDWLLVVRADGEELYRQAVSRAASKDGWMDVTVDLSRFRGKAPLLELSNEILNNFDYETGYWGRIAFSWAPVTSRVDKSGVYDDSEIWAGDLTTRVSQFQLLDEYWSVIDMSAYMGKELTLTIQEGDLSKIVLTDDLKKQIPDLYHEANRPQFHFSYRTGVMGDPTAMVYYPPNKEWHLFTIANPLRGAEICWGHAVSKDLVHWEETTPIFHFPHLICNGVGIVDTNNLLGLNQGRHQAIVLFTSIIRHPGGDIFMTVSIDGGRSFHDLNDLADSLNRPDLKINPICPGRGDAPRAWYNPVAKKYFLSHCRWGEIDGKHQVILPQFTSQDLKTWTPIENFPRLIYDNWPGEGDAFDMITLLVDGDPKNKVVLVSGGAKGYALAQYSKTGLNNLQGVPLSPKDTIYSGYVGFPTLFSHAPNGRAVMFANVGNAGASGQPNHEVGFKPNLSVPLELSLRTTPDGVRLFKNPVKELEMLHGKEYQYKNLAISQENTPIQGPQGGLYRIKTRIHIGDAESLHFNIRGFDLEYDVRGRKFRHPTNELWQQWSHFDALPKLRPLDSGVITIEILVDRTSLEVFVNEGEAFFYAGRRNLYKFQGKHDLLLSAKGGEATVKSIKVSEINPIWNEK